MQPTTSTAPTTIGTHHGVTWVCYAEPGDTTEEHAARVATMREAFDAAVARATSRRRRR